MKKDNLFYFFLFGICLGISQSFVWLIPLVFISYFFLIIQTFKENQFSRSFTKGWVFGVGFFLSSMHWIVSPFLIYERHLFLSPISLLFPILMGLFFSVPTVLILIFKKYFNLSLNRLFFLNSFFVALIFFFSELLRSYLFGGLPFNLVAHIWAYNSYFIQIVQFIGVFGLSFLTILWIVFLTFNLHGKNFLVFFSILIIFPLFLMSFNFLPKKNKIFSNSEELNIRIVQPSIPQKRKWEKSSFGKNIESLIELTVEKNNPMEDKVVVWPEVALTLFFNEEYDFQKFLQKNIPENITLITGSLRRSFSNNGYKVFNSLYIFKDEILDYYDKKKLVPFGEFIPLRGVLNLFKLTPGYSDYSRGEKKNEMFFFNNNSKFFFEPSICYEAIFQTSQSKNSNLIINVTNDAWFGKTTGPRQHLAAQIFRSVEKGAVLIRVANSGISALVNTKGKIEEKIELDISGYIDKTIKLESNETFFEKSGNLALALFIIFLFLLFCLIEFLFSLKRKY
jgi:apolipoprotein N-acyltransferase